MLNSENLMKVKQDKEEHNKNSWNKINKEIPLSQNI